MTAGGIVPVSFDIPVPAPPTIDHAVGSGVRGCNNKRVLAQAKRRRLYRAFVDMADPETCRRASYSFNITVVDDFPDPTPEWCPP